MPLVCITVHCIMTDYEPNVVWKPHLSARKSYKNHIQNLQKLIWFAGNIMHVFNQHEEMFLINLLACRKYIKAELINGSSVTNSVLFSSRHTLKS